MSAANLVRFLSAPEPDYALFSPIEAERERSVRTLLSTWISGNCKEMLEARVGIEPTDKGFADLSLTTWVPRPVTFTVDSRRGFV